MAPDGLAAGCRHAAKNPFGKLVTRLGRRARN